MQLNHIARTGITNLFKNLLLTKTTNHRGIGYFITPYFLVLNFGQYMNRMRKRTINISWPGNVRDGV